MTEVRNEDDRSPQRSPLVKKRDVSREFAKTAKTARNTVYGGEMSDITYEELNPNDTYSTAWMDYQGNNWYSARAQAVMDVCADCLARMRRLPTVAEVKEVTGLNDDEIGIACANLAEYGWKDYADIVGTRPTPAESALTKRKPIMREIRAAVWAKTGGHCWYCGVMTNPFENFHIDHVQPVIDGGANDLLNLVPSCQWCNLEKHDSALETFRRRRGGGVFWFERQGRP